MVERIYGFFKTFFFCIITFVTLKQIRNGIQFSIDQTILMQNKDFNFYNIEKYENLF